MSEAPAASGQIRISDVIRIVAKHYGVSHSRLLGRERTSTLSKIRHVGVYLASSVAGKRPSVIARGFLRDHATIAYAIRKIAAERQQDRMLNAEIEMLSRKILAVTS